MKISVKQEHIDNGRMEPGAGQMVCENCPVALALKEAGLVDPFAGYGRMHWTDKDTGLEVSARTPAKVYIWMQRFDSRRLGEPFSFDLTTDR